MFPQRRVCGMEQADWGAAQLDLAVELGVSGQGLAMMLHYNAALFSEGTAQRIAHHYVVRGMPSAVA